MQDLIGRYSDLIAGDKGDLLLVKREQGIADQTAGADRWSIDHLFVDADATPVLVEVKRATDTRLRREVIGQVLDYAANGSVYWTSAQLSQSFASTCAELGQVPFERLEAFLDMNPDGFWDRVETKLRDGQVRIVIAADRIPTELARVIEFLNEQMRAEVLGVELRYFESKDGRLMLAPETIGQSELQKARKSPNAPAPFDLEGWLLTGFGDAGSPRRTGADRWVEIVQDLGAEITVTNTRASVISKMQMADGTKVFPMYLWSQGDISVCFHYNRNRGKLADDGLRQEILDRFDAAVGPMNPKNPRGWPTFPPERLADPSVADAFREVARDWLQLCQDPG